MSSLRKSAGFRIRGQDMTALVERIADREESAFATFYDMTSALIYGLLLQILGNPETAQQVLVAVYQKVWEQSAAYDGEYEKPLTWLIMMARINAIARLRADKQEHERQTRRLIMSPRAITTNSKTDETISDQQRMMRAALVALPPVQQQMLELAYFAGLHQNEITSRLGVSLHSVQAGIRDGVTRLRDTLKHHQRYDALGSVTGTVNLKV